MIILTTICYLTVDNQTLMLFRDKKKDDINQGKWIGIGGKIEPGELPADCVKREFFEETGLKISGLKLKGYILFPGLIHGEDEGMFLYSADHCEGVMKEQCEEGELAWIQNQDLWDLPMWEGDQYFQTWLDRPGFTEASLTYRGDHLIAKKEKYFPSTETD